MNTVKDTIQELIFIIAKKLEGTGIQLTKITKKKQVMVICYLLFSKNGRKICRALTAREYAFFNRPQYGIGYWVESFIHIITDTFRVWEETAK